MLKNAIKKRIIISIITLFILFIIYIIPTNKEYEKYIMVNNNTNNIYLLNNNMLVRCNTISNSTNTREKIKEIINTLTINSKESNYINHNLKPIIPKNTRIIDLSLDNKLLKINFSKEILNISKEKEEKLIESIIYSLTELEDVDNIMIFVEGELLTKLPNSNKTIPALLNRNYGINKIYDLTNIYNSSKVTIYYFTNIDNIYSAVPVTIFTNETSEKVEVIIKNLKSSNIYQTDLVSFLNNNTKLLDYEIEENTIKLNFNQYLLDTFYDDYLIEEVKYAISNSIKDSLNIKNTKILVNGKAI